MAQLPYTSFHLISSSSAARDEKSLLFRPEIPMKNTKKTELDRAVGRAGSKLIPNSALVLNIFCIAQRLGPRLESGLALTASLNVLRRRQQQTRRFDLLGTGRATLARLNGNMPTSTAKQVRVLPAAVHG